MYGRSRCIKVLFNKLVFIITVTVDYKKEEGIVASNYFQIV